MGFENEMVVILDVGYGGKGQTFLFGCSKSLGFYEYFFSIWLKARTYLVFNLDFGIRLGLLFKNMWIEIEK